METHDARAYRSCMGAGRAELTRRYGDVVLAGGLVAVALAQTWLLNVSTGAKLATSAVVVVLGIFAAVRVRAPVHFLAALVGLVAVGTLLPKRFGDVESTGLFLLLAVYSGAAHTSGRRTIAAGALSLALFLTLLIADPEESNLSAVVYFALIIGGPWAAGRAIRRRRLSERTLEREKGAAEHAIAEERARIARELHDVVAHAISVIVLQARGGRRLLESEPDQTRFALDTIERSGEQALTEMRRLVGMLRENDEQLALAPHPSLSHLDGLLEKVRAAGLPVELAVEGEPVQLPPGIDLSAYRIVQEALTNALKHAGPARARVRLCYEPEGLEVEVADDGTGGGNGDGAGHGIAGIRERVAVYGGELETGRRSEGGYALRARLPYASER
jgi:signal transduction histidine kinase